MRPLHVVAKDLRELGEMLLSCAEELEVAGQTMSNLFGPQAKGEVKPAAVPKDENPKRRQKPGPASGRRLTQEEKDQIRLLWSQSNKDRKVMIPQLAETYHAPAQAVAGIIDHPPGRSAVLKSASSAS